MHVAVTEPQGNSEPARAASKRAQEIDVIIACVDADLGAQLAEALRVTGLRIRVIVRALAGELRPFVQGLSRGGVVFIEDPDRVPALIDEARSVPHSTCVALVEIDELRAALSRGVDDVLPRPWSADALLARIEVARARAAAFDLELAPWSLHAPDAIAVLDASGTVLAWSLAAVDCLEYEARDIVGRSFETMLCEDFCWVFPALAEGSADLLSGVHLRRASGEAIVCTLHIAHWRIGDGRRIGLRIEESADVSDELMRIASYPELNPQPIFELGSDDALMYMNPAFLALDAALRESLVAAAQRVLTETPIFTGGVLSREVFAGEHWFHQVIHATGEWQSVRVYAQDITERKLADVSLREAHDSLDRKVKERTTDLRREVEIRKRAEEAALAANEAKSAFLATMSHELRTPLNAVIGYAELLRDEFGESQASDDLGKIVTAAHHLLGLINDILDLSKIEAGRVALEVETVDLQEAVRDVAATIGTAAAARGNHIEVAVDSSCSILKTDPRRLRQILLNLCGNAAKFTSDGVIRIAVAPVIADRVVELIVSDTGIGIPENKVEQIFEPFTQADSSTAREYGGTGLGLAISRKLAELLGGSLRATSQLGVGSQFTLRLPCTDLHGKTALS